MIQYFEALVTVMASDRSYLTNFLKKCPAVAKDGARAPGGKNRKADDHDDSKSVASDMSSSTTSTFSPPPGFSNYKGKKYQNKLSTLKEDSWAHILKMGLIDSAYVYRILLLKNWSTVFYLATWEVKLS